LIKIESFEIEKVFLMIEKSEKHYLEGIKLKMNKNMNIIIKPKNKIYMILQSRKVD
jgi:hypothetical protein